MAQAPAGAEVPAQRAAGAHLDQLGQPVGADSDGVAGAGGDAGPALDAAVGVDDGLLELPEPELAGGLLDVVHLVADLVSGHVRAAFLGGWLAARRWGAPRPLVERLAVAPFGAVAGQQAGQGLQLVDRLGALDPVDERGVGAEAAAEPDVDRLQDLVVAVGGLAAEADVGDLGLGAGGRAPGEVHPHDAVAGLVGPSRRSSSRAQVAALALVSTIAKRQNSLPVQATTPRSKAPGLGMQVASRARPAAPLPAGWARR